MVSDVGLSLKTRSNCKKEVVKEHNLVQKKYEVALKLEIPKSMVHEIVHDTLGYQKVSARWVPEMLTEDNKLQRVEISQRLLLRCQQDNGDEDMTHISVRPAEDF
ncbi:histone-lysine N-methyltransferase SETMAR [Elysia marginata]|uniref:Histone-lysine N-methyltransferase SETMAR n=1 Tax=Elysia marginata TaxID=1093978 RepID=A0AAV4EAI3_9GAST|nr:histone-lysine N-methyltransferase SETMAR [Elysia marginata]